MRPLYFLLGFFVAALCAATARADNLAIRGGQVFDGEKFVARDLFVRDGVFVEERPEKIDRTIDATGLFLLPPFAEAHTHSFFGGPQSKGANAALLRTGVFYALCANNPSEVSSEWRGLSDEDLGGSRVDVLFANGGITSPGGHPVELYRMIHTRFMAQPAETFMEVNDGSAFYQVANSGALAAAFEKLLASDPDLIKLYLLGHDTGGMRFSIQGSEAIHTGLDEQSFRAAVAKAHDAGKRCIVHVETASDIALAADAGADALAHLPYALRADEKLPLLRISAETARRVAKQKMAVIATSGLGLTVVSRQSEGDLQAQVREVWEGNLRILKEAGAIILVGSDQFTPISEANSLERSGIFTRLEILRMWTRDTPRWMFPDRKIGAIEPGCEASMIGLAANPLDDWQAIQQVKLSIKNGKVLAGAPEPGAELMD